MYDTFDNKWNHRLCHPAVPYEGVTARLSVQVTSLSRSQAVGYGSAADDELFCRCAK